MTPSPACLQLSGTTSAAVPIEALGQDVRGDAGDLAEKVVEPARAGEQCLHHQQCPPVADPGQRLGER